MDYTWMWPPFGGFWMFGLLCMAVMVLMMVLMARHGGCLPFLRRSSAREILERRYASGELDKAQYDAMRRDLGERT